MAMRDGMVDHLTRVRIPLLDGDPPLDPDAAPTAAAVRAAGERARAHAERVARMIEALAERGFTFRAERGRVVAESAAVEAGEAKRHLLALGFRDREFQIVLEYARRWGIL